MRNANIPQPEVDWADLMHRVALRLFGEPNDRLSSFHKGQLRWGNRGSLSMVVAPHPDAGVWYDHEAREGGGILRLLEYGMGLHREDAIRWLRDEGYLDGMPPDIQPPVRDPETLERNRKRRLQEAQTAAQRAQRMLTATRQDTHPYLASKGFPDHLGLVAPNGLLYIPMYRIRGGSKPDNIWAVQTIDVDGNKKFQPKGCAAAATAHFIGRGQRWGQEIWVWCEGYVTGLSIREALDATVWAEVTRVVVAFSASGIAKYAKGGVIVAEHDRYKCRVDDCGHRWAAPWGDAACPECGGNVIDPPAGERAARETGLPFWMPPNSGEDANDYWRREGTQRLADQIGGLVAGAYAADKTATRRHC